MTLIFTQAPFGCKHFEPILN